MVPQSTELEEYPVYWTRVINMRTQQEEYFTVDPKAAVLIAHMQSIPDEDWSKYKDVIPKMDVLEGAKTYTCGDFVAYKKGYEANGMASLEKGGIKN